MFSLLIRHFEKKKICGVKECLKRNECQATNELSRAMTGVKVNDI